MDHTYNIILFKFCDTYLAGCLLFLFFIIISCNDLHTVNDLIIYEWRILYVKEKIEQKDVYEYKEARFYRCDGWSLK